MGAKTLSAAALAALLASSPSLAQAPKPGALETYKDWTIGCDNRNRCEAVALMPEGADWPEVPLMIGVAREAGPDAATEVWISRESKGVADVSFLVDGRTVATARARDGEAKVRGPQASALAIAMARGTTMDVRAVNRSWGTPSLAGSGAALRYMDARQGRAGTMTALVATGPMGVMAVKPAPTPPVIRRAPVPGGTAPAPLWREELAKLVTFTGCAHEMRSDQTPELHRLSKTETLILVPCGSGAYNFTSVPVIAPASPVVAPSASRPSTPRPAGSAMTSIPPWSMSAGPRKNPAWTASPRDAASATAVAAKPMSGTAPDSVWSKPRAWASAVARGTGFLPGMPR